MTAMKSTEVAAFIKGKVFSGGLKPFSLDSMQSVAVFRERPSFTCYIDGLDA